MVAGLDAPDALADLGHHPGAFMAQNHRRPVPVVNKTDVGMADARGDDPDQDFVVARPFQFEGFDLQGTAAGAQHRRLDWLDWCGTVSQVRFLGGYGGKLLHSRIVINGSGKDYFPLTLTLSPMGGEGIKRNPIYAPLRFMHLNIGKI